MSLLLDDNPVRLVSRYKRQMFIFEPICFPIFTYWRDLEENITSMNAKFVSSTLMIL